MILWKNRIFLLVSSTLLTLVLFSCSLNTQQSSSNLSPPTDMTKLSTREIPKKLHASTVKAQHGSKSKHSKQRLEEDYLPPGTGEVGAAPTGTGERPPNIEKNAH